MSFGYKSPENVNGLFIALLVVICLVDLMVATTIYPYQGLILAWRFHLT